MRLLLLALSLSLGLWAQDTTVVMVRHAEKVSNEPDAALSEAGLRRAQALVAQLRTFKPTVLFASERRRTQQTLAPTAKSLGLQPLIRPSNAPEALAQEMLRDHRGKVILLAWHHGPHEPFVRALGVQGPLPIWTSSTYDRIWVISLPTQGPAHFEERIQRPSEPNSALSAR